METSSDSIQHIIHQYLIAGLQSREQALRAARSQSADSFIAVADDFINFSQLTKRWLKGPARPNGNQDHRHHGHRLLQTLAQNGFQLNRRHRLPSLLGDEPAQSQLIIELVRIGRLTSPKPEVRFRRRYQRLFLNLEGLHYPSSIRPILSSLNPAEYLLRHLSEPSLTAFIVRRDLQQAGVKIYIHPGKNQSLQLRLSCLEQLRLPFSENTETV